MNENDDNFLALGEVDLRAVFRKLEESRLPGASRPHVEAGYHWHYEATAPDGSALCGIMKGPFSTIQEAVEHQQTYHLIKIGGETT